MSAGSWPGIVPFAESGPLARLVTLERKLAAAERAIDSLSIVADSVARDRQPYPWNRGGGGSGGLVQTYVGTLAANLFRGSTTNVTIGSSSKSVLTTGVSGFLPSGKTVVGILNQDDKFVCLTPGITHLWVTNPSSWNGASSQTSTSVPCAGVTLASISYTDPEQIILLFGGSVESGARLKITWDEHSLIWKFLTANKCPNQSSTPGSSIGTMLAMMEALEGTV